MRPPPNLNIGAEVVLNPYFTKINSHDRDLIGPVDKGVALADELEPSSHKVLLVRTPGFHDVTQAEFQLWSLLIERLLVRCYGCGLG